MVAINTALFSAEKLSRDICGAASMMLGADVAGIPGYEDKLVARVVQHAGNLAFNLKGGRITGETRNFMVDGVKQHIKHFVEALKSEDIIALNKAHFAVTFVVFKTVSDASGVEIKA